MRLDSAVFYSHDLEKVIPFYRDTIGLTVEYEQKDRFVSFLFANDVRLGIKKKAEDREIPGAGAIFISVEDIDHVYAEMKRKNASITKELVTEDWGTNFSIADPDGNKIQYVQKSKSR